MGVIQKFSEKFPILSNFLWALLFSIVLYALTRFLLNRLYPRLKDTGNWYVIRKVARWINNLAIFFIFLFVFNDKLTGLSTTLGLASAGITYALREVIVSFAGWFAIMFGDFFKTGERVLLGGIKGDVVDIGVLRTTLMEIGEWVEGDQYTGRFVRVANSYIFNSPVYNYTADFDYLWDEIHIPIRFSSDIEEARNILLDLADHQIGNYNAPATKEWKKMQRKYQLEDASLRTQVYVTFNDNWIEMSLRYIVDYKERRAIKDKLSTEILKRFKAAGDKIQIAADTIEVIRTSPTSNREKREHQ